MNEDKSILIKKLNELLLEQADDKVLLAVAEQLCALLKDSNAIDTKEKNVTILSSAASLLSQNEEDEKTPAPKKKKVNHTKLIEKELSYFQTYLEQEQPNKNIQQTLFSEDEEDIKRNEELRNAKKKIADNYPIRELKSAISINDRYLYINQLFRGDATAYERSIHTINKFSTLKESLEWIERTLRLTYFWDENDKTVKQFYNVVKRRFS